MREEGFFPKSGANRFRTGAGYFLNRVQRYNKFLEYANFEPRKMKFFEKPAYNAGE